MPLPVMTSPQRNSVKSRFPGDASRRTRAEGEAAGSFGWRPVPDSASAQGKLDSMGLSGSEAASSGRLAGSSRDANGVPRYTPRDMREIATAAGRRCPTWDAGSPRLGSSMLHPPQVSAAFWLFAVGTGFAHFQP